MLKSINHIGIAVKNLDESIKIFRNLFNFVTVYTETVSEQKVRIASFKVGDVLIELTSPLDESSPVAKFILKRGEGIHHIAFETDNIDKELEKIKNNGITLLNESPQPGAHELLISFLHPKSTNGVLIEICQKQ